MDYEIILASSSDRRKEILDRLGVKYQAIPSDKEEHMSDDYEPAELVKELALMKASDVAEKISGKAVIIGADTVVAFENRILGKPKDEQDAYNTIKSLSGKSHYVYSGICFIIKEEDGTSKVHTFHVPTLVNVHAMTEEQIEAYIATKDSLGKAGSYGIQGLFSPYVESIEGDFFNIVGFPIAAIHHELLKFGINLLKK